MLLSTKNTTLICPANDLESVTILAIARRYGMDVIEVAGGWGTKFTPEIIPNSKIEALRENIIIVELPGDEIEDTLRAAGKKVFRVDHHEYGGQTIRGANRASSLEQFARLIGHELTREEWEIAINDRDFLPGLSRAGVSLGRAMHLRQQELAIRGKESDMEEAIKWVDKHARNLDDLRFALVPQQFSGAMLEAAQYPACGEYEKAAAELRAVALKPTLVLFHADDDREKIVKLGFAGPEKERGWLEAILNEAAYIADFQMWLGGGQYGCFFGAKARANHPGPAINDLVSRLLENRLITGRPLQYYTCTFHLPLDLMLEQDIGNVNYPFAEASNHFAEHHVLELGTTPEQRDREKNAEAQSFHYFLPYLRNVVYETNADSAGQGRNLKYPEPIQHWRLKDVKGSTLAVARENKEPPLSAQISEIALYRYFNGLYCLAFRVELPVMPSSSLNSYEQNWWRDLFYADDAQFSKIKDRQASGWLRYTKLVRLLYHSFPEQEAEKKISPVTLNLKQNQPVSFHKTALRLPCYIGEEVSPIVMDLLARFFAQNEGDLNSVKDKLKTRLDHIPDDRMYVNVAYGLAGPAPRSGDVNAWEQHERLFSLALFVDASSDGFPEMNSWVYDEKFVRNKMPGLCLDRWKGIGTRSGYTDYSNVHLGYGGFFCDPIASTHVPYLYGRMLLLALFYQASLRHYQRWVTLATNELIGDGKNKGLVTLRDARRNFIEFTNNYWFREITSQIQGKEIFAKQVAVLEIKEEYDLVKDEMERADEFMESDYQTELNKKMGIAAIVGLVLAGASLIFAGAQVDGVGPSHYWLCGGFAVWLLAGVWGFFQWRDLGRKRAAASCVRQKYD